jgi:hypothetical protein
MSLKQEIETWVSALARYDNNEFDESLGEFDKISDTSKILFNMGVIHATLGEHEKAVECYQRSIKLDQYLAVAYFQQGVSNFLLGDFEEALANFNDTLLYLRGNTVIDYAQLGLLFKLYSCEVLFNRGLCYIYLQQKEAGMADLGYAVKEKVVEDHNVIDEAIREEAEGYTVFSIPVGVVYRPNEAKVRNLKTKDYLGKARLVAASDRANAFTGFAGSEIKNAGKVPVKDDRPTDGLSFAAANLVKPNLSSKRQQSEPPGARDVFPPTPPPEDKPAAPTRAQSVRGGKGPMPARLNIERARTGFEPQTLSPPDRRTLARSNTTGGPLANVQRMASSYARSAPVIDENQEAYPDSLYDAYAPPPPASMGTRGSSMRSRNGPPPQQQQQQQQQRRYAAPEEDDYEGSDVDGSFDEDEFEMMNAPPRRGSSRRARSSSREPPARRPSRPEVRKVRMKVHVVDDVRYLQVDTTIEYQELVDRIRDKFQLRRRFKIKVRDDDMPNGDMITLGDQDDLEMVVMTAKAQARRQRLDVGRMEIWIQEL